MTLKDFSGDTFVAYLDIIDFKKLMKDKNTAIDILNKFYRFGYEALNKSKKLKKYEEINGIFISDCGILYSRNNNIKESLKSLLWVIKEITSKMLNEKILLTTSITYGYFKYKKKKEFLGIEKNPVYGKAYVDAFLDTEKGEPKIRPGQCRIKKENYPLNNKLLKFNRDKILKLVKVRNMEKKYYYFYWMLKNPLNSNKVDEIYLKLPPLGNKEILEDLKKIKDEKL